MATDQMELDLRDIHLPEPISWWPPAPGWWMVLVGIVLLITLVVFLRKRWLKKKNSAKTLARNELKNIQEKYQQLGDSQILIKDLSTLLRRTCISVFPRLEAAGLTGDAWLSFLDQGIQRKQFSEGIGEILVSGPYKKTVDLNAEELIVLCKDWIEALP